MTSPPFRFLYPPVPLINKNRRTVRRWRKGNRAVSDGHGKWAAGNPSDLTPLKECRVGQMNRSTLSPQLEAFQFGLGSSSIIGMQTIRLPRRLASAGRLLTNGVSAKTTTSTESRNGATASR